MVQIMHFYWLYISITLPLGDVTTYSNNMLGMQQHVSCELYNLSTVQLENLAGN